MSFSKKISYVFLLCALLALNSHADTQHIPPSVNNIKSNLAKLDSLLSINKAELPIEESLALSTHIIKKRNFYDDSTIAKAYRLLSDIATNRGDASKAFQFAKDGLSLNIIDPIIKLDLQLKIIASYYAEGKFQDVKNVADNIISFANDESLITYRLKALGYRAVFYALTVDYPNTLKDLQQVKSILDIHKKFSDHVDLLKILATAHHYLGDYETAISIQLKVLNLRYEMAQTDTLGESYFALASAYKELDRLDDAYDTFWQAQQQAKNSQSLIQQAYAELGLGEVLLLQGEYSSSLAHLNKAQTLFSGHNLSKPYLSTLILLSKVHIALNNTNIAYKQLTKAEYLAKNISLSTEQIELYYLLSTMYKQLNQQEKAWVMLNKYTKLYRNKDKQRTALLADQQKVDQESQQNRKATLQLAIKSELQIQYQEKEKQQKKVELQLLFLILILCFFIMMLLFKHRQYKQQSEFKSIIANSTETKQMYQSAYKMARKYEYNLSVTYLVIHNWKELTFQSNRKELLEVCRTIETVINEYIQEFDLAGQLNDGQYLLIFPHQKPSDVEKLVAALSEALKVRFFGNLGERAVNINYKLDNLNVQDIDPFIFLSKLIDSVKDT